MVDGSHLPLGENILYTKNISSLAHAEGILVEAELGRLSGTEDGLTVEEYEARFTDMAQVIFSSPTNFKSKAFYSCINCKLIWHIFSG
jgi:fructose/tagatose bisphosphate aldolase